MYHFHVFKSNLYLETVCVLYLNPTLAHGSLPLLTGTSDVCSEQYPVVWELSFSLFQLSAWVVFPVLYKSVFFPDYLLLINLFFLRGRRLSCLLMTCVRSSCESVGGGGEGERSDVGKRGRVGGFIMKGSRRVTWLPACGSLQEDSMALQVVWFITATVFSSVHLTPLVSLEGKFTHSSTRLL